VLVTLSLFICELDADASVFNFASWCGERSAIPIARANINNQ
jgi:hypothetical protein